MKNLKVLQPLETLDDELRKFCGYGKSQNQLLTSERIRNNSACEYMKNLKVLQHLEAQEDMMKSKKSVDMENLRTNWTSESPESEQITNLKV